MSVNQAFHAAVNRMRRQAERIQVSQHVVAYWPDAQPIGDPGHPYGQATDEVMQCGGGEVQQTVVGDLSHDHDHRF